MNNLTNIIEGIVFASCEAEPVKNIIEKLACTIKEVNAATAELKKKYDEVCGIQLLTFNGKLQFATNPQYKQQISDVLTPIKEKEFTKTILECAALIAYKQPVTKGELEDIRQVNCDYAVHTLLELQMIEPCGRKDAVGKPILYATTDNFLKRFKLNSIDELPDYDELMAQIAELNDTILKEEEGGNYLYRKDEYNPDEDAENAAGEAAAADATQPEEEKQPVYTEDGYEVPEFLNSEENVIKIK